MRAWFNGLEIRELIQEFLLKYEMLQTALRVATWVLEWETIYGARDSQGENV